MPPLRSPYRMGPEVLPRERKGRVGVCYAIGGHVDERVVIRLDGVPEGGAGGEEISDDHPPGKNARLVMRLVVRESSKNEPRNELDSLVTSLFRAYIL